jgi:hypothetical protein
MRMFNIYAFTNVIVMIRWQQLSYMTIYNYEYTNIYLCMYICVNIFWYLHQEGLSFAFKAVIMTIMIISMDVDTCMYVLYMYI